MASRFLLGAMGLAACSEYVAASVAKQDDRPDGGGFVTEAGVPLPKPPCDGAETIEEPAVFVAPDGDDAKGAGTRAAPYRTVTRALARLDPGVLVAARTVVLAEGEYNEALVLSDVHAGTSIRGGFTRRESVWTRDCGDGARDRTVLRSPSAVGLSVTYTQNVASAAPITVRTLVLATKAVGGSSSSNERAAESLYGAFVNGGRIALDDVLLRVGTGGSGGGAAPGQPGQQGQCVPCDNGAQGAGGVPPRPAAAGALTPSGYVPGNGAVGTAGGGGQPGTAGVPQSVFCLDFCDEDPMFSTCVPRRSTLVLQGTCGCGGGGGGGGSGGFGGGASIGVFATGPGARIAFEYVEMQLGAGGAGSAGGQAGTGAAGLIGTDSAPCATACDTRCGPDVASYQFGARGGPGGDGAAGTAGSGGAGGDSIGVALMSAATADALDPAAIRLGPGGKGEDGAPSGRSLPRAP